MAVPISADFLSFSASRSASRLVAFAPNDRVHPRSVRNDRTPSRPSRRWRDRVGGQQFQAEFGSSSVRAHLDAVIVYWGTVSDLVQRQEHGAAKEGEALTWEDARRVVFQTVNLFHELAGLA